MARNASPPYGVFDSDQKSPCCSMASGGFILPYTYFCDRVVFSKEDIVSIEILFFLWYF